MITISRVSTHPTLPKVIPKTEPITIPRTPQILPPLPGTPAPEQNPDDHPLKRPPGIIPGEDPTPKGEYWR